MNARPSPIVRTACLALLALAVLAAFEPALRAGWIQFDDPVYVVENPWIRGGFQVQNLRWVLGSIHGGNWHPLTSLSHMLDVQLFGLRPFGPHLENVLLHTASTLLLAWLCFRLTGAWWTSLVCAALFGLHPLRVESVAWISERKDVLSLLLCLSTLLAWLRWTERPSRPRYALALGLYLLGLCAKPMLVTLPGLLLLFDHWPLARSRSAGGRLGWRGLLREKWPFLAAGAAFSAITFLVQHAAGAVSSTQWIAPALRVQNAILSCGSYVGTTFWPVDLSVYYPYLRPASPWPAIGIGLALLAATALFWRLRRRNPALLVGWLWFLGTLVPVIGLVQVGGQAHADRYTYLPGIGLLVALLFGLRPAPFERGIGALLALGCLPLLLATRAQAALWKDTRTLFAHALAVTQRNALAEQVYGNALLLDGEIEPAIAHLRAALALVPDFPDAHNNLGTALGSQGDLEGAIVEFRAALRSQETADTRHNLGFALLRLGRTDEAMRELERALVLDPRHARAHATLGNVLGAQGRLAEAEQHLAAALERQPDDPVTRRAQAVTLTLEGKVEQGIAAYEQLLALVPDDADALNNIAWIRATHADARHRDGAQAVRLAERARDCTAQENAVLLSTLGAAYAEAGRFADAQRSATRAVELARAEHDEAAAQRFEAQLACYRAGRPFRLP